MPLFVVLEPGRSLTYELVAQIRTKIREACSPRHVPNVVVATPSVPRTLTGKVLEVPVKKLFMGQPAEKVATKDALANPEAFDWFVDYVASRPMSS
jgi:acetoacetyl-CoA synthetase